MSSAKWCPFCLALSVLKNKLIFLPKTFCLYAYIYIYIYTERDISNMYMKYFVSRFYADKALVYEADTQFNLMQMIAPNQRLNLFSVMKIIY